MSTETEKLMRMGELAEASGVPVPTIKHYLREGLLPEPVKTSRNMASERAVALLELEDRILDRALAGERSRTSAAEVRERYGVPKEVLDRLEELEVLSPNSRGYSPSDIKIIEAISRFRAGGYDEEIGFTVYDTLRYKTAIEELVRQEVEVVMGRLAGEDRRRLAGIVLSTVIVLVAVILATQGGGGGDPPEVGSAPRIVDVDEVLAVAGSLGHPIYWAGLKPSTQLELREEPEGSVYLRYLPEGTDAGEAPGGFLTVGTYPVADAQGALRSTAAKAGSTVSHTDDGALVLVNPAESTSVYLAYPQSDLQLEVYDPRPGRALELIRSGAIRPVS